MTDSSPKLSRSAAIPDNEGAALRDSMNPKTHPKKRQSAKIKEFGEALAAEGFNTLDDQARVLGLSRSTTWTILRASHKTSGLSVKIIKRILAAPNPSSTVRFAK
jgi:hypothetical protein